MSAIDLDALERMAKDAIFDDDPEDWPLEGAVGWDRPEDNKFVAALTPGTVLALIARVRELEAIVNDGGNQAAKYWTRLNAAEREMHARELHHFEEEKLRAEAEAERDRYRAMLDRVRALEPMWPRGMYGCPQDMFGRGQIAAALNDKEAEK